jgi:hypothetical protein
MVNGTKGCWAKLDGDFALEHIQGQIEWKIHSPQLDPKAWTWTFE